MVGPANEKLGMLVSIVKIVFGKLVPLKVKPSKFGLELNGGELKEPKVIPVTVTVSARATPWLKAMKRTTATPKTKDFAPAGKALMGGIS
jgi:hypothetical protein